MEHLMPADEIVKALRRSGVTITLVPPDGLRLCPASKIPPSLVPIIKQEKPAILAFVRARKEATTCRYDWQPGYRGLRLCCVGHQHAAGTATVLRIPRDGHDPLLEMAELGILTGQAAEDAGRVM